MSITRFCIERNVAGSSRSEDVIEALVQKKVFHWVCWWQFNTGNSNYYLSLRIMGIK
jgi:hypothetical protein